MLRNRPVPKSADSAVCRTSPPLAYRWRHRARSASWLTSLLVVATLALGVSAAEAVQIVEFPLMPGSQPQYIALGPDGNLWFTEAGTNEIGRITPGGVITSFKLGLTPKAGLTGIAAGPDGNIWFTERESHRIGRITPQGVISEFETGLTQKPEIFGITAGPEGKIWFTEANNSRVGTINPATGTIAELPGPPGTYTNIATGPDGNLWYTISNRAVIARMTAAGTVTESKALPETDCAAGAPKPCPYPLGIASGADGDLWFGEVRGDAIGRVTPSGDVSEYSSGLTRGAGVFDLTAGAEGNMWFTERTADQIGRITPAGTIAEFNTGLTSGAEPLGIALGSEGNLWVAEPGTSEIAMVIPEVPPVVATGGASSVTYNSAAVSGSVRSRGADTHYAFEYGATTAYGASTAAADNGAGDNTQPVSAGLAGLAPATTYHYRLVASNASGVTFGADQTFTTQPAPPKVTVGPFEMYFSGYRSGRSHLRVTRIVVIELANGDRVFYRCERCHGYPAVGRRSVRNRKVTFATPHLTVSERSLIRITVMAADGSRRVRTYGFRIRQAEVELKGQQCFYPHSGVVVACPGSPSRPKPKSRHAHRPTPARGHRRRRHRSK